MKKSIKIALFLILIGSILAITGYSLGGAKCVYISEDGIHLKD